MSDFYLQIEKSKETDLCSFFEGIDICILVKRGEKNLLAFSFISHSLDCYTGFMSADTTQTLSVLMFVSYLGGF